MAINVFDPTGSDSVLAEQALKNSYETIKFIVANISQIRSISEKMDEVVRLFASADQMDAIAAQIDKLDALHASLTQILSVYDGIGDIVALGSHIEPLLAIQTELDKLTAVYDGLSYIISIGPHVAAIQAIGAALTDVTTIANNMNALVYVADNLETVLSTIGGVDGVIDTRMATQADALAAASSTLLISPVRVAQYVSSLVGTGAGMLAAGDDARISGASQKSANLSDLTDKPAARTALGLGNSATRDVGTAANTVAAGNDSRFATIPVPLNQAEAEAGTDNQKYMTALRNKQANANKLDKTGDGSISGKLTIEGGIPMLGSLGSWSANGWATPIALTQGHALQWKKGTGEFSWNVGISGDVFMVNRKATDALDGTGAVTSLFQVSGTGVITTAAYGNLGTYIDARAASYASSAQAAAISSANATAASNLNSRVSSVALGGSWASPAGTGQTAAPAGGVMTGYVNTGSSESSSGSGKYIYYYLPSTGWVVAGAI